MRKSQISVVGLALAAGYVLAGFVNRPTAGQSPALEALPAPHAGAVWQYHTTVVSTGGGYPLLILTDTTTGHCWIRESSPQDDDDWRDLGTPGTPRK